MYQIYNRVARFQLIQWFHNCEFVCECICLCLRWHYNCYEQYNKLNGVTHCLSISFMCSFDCFRYHNSNRCAYVQNVWVEGGGRWRMKRNEKNQFVHLVHLVSWSKQIYTWSLQHILNTIEAEATFILDFHLLGCKRFQGLVNERIS